LVKSEHPLSKTIIIITFLLGAQLLPIWMKQGAKQEVKILILAFGSESCLVSLETISDVQSNVWLTLVQAYDFEGGHSLYV